MNKAKGTPPRVAQPPMSKAEEDEDSHDDDSHETSSGRATFDSRGNAVWEWKTESGEYSADISTQRLKKLEATELSIEETARLKKLHGLSLEEEGPGGGFDPYDRGTPQPYKPQAHAHKSGNKTAVTHAKPAETPRKPIKDLKRLQEWMDMKKRLENQKDDD